MGRCFQKLNDDRDEAGWPNLDLSRLLSIASPFYCNQELSSTTHFVLGAFISSSFFGKVHVQLAGIQSALNPPTITLWFLTFQCPDPCKTQWAIENTSIVWMVSLICWREGDDVASRRATISDCKRKGPEPWQNKRPLWWERPNVFV